jgi:hypothetical protein
MARRNGAHNRDLPSRQRRYLVFECLEQRALLSGTDPAAAIGFSELGSFGVETANEIGVAAGTLPPLRQMEHLDRGVIALRTGTSSGYIGWRMLGTDPPDVAFNLYRSADGGEPVRLNAAPLTQTTDFVDTASTGFNAAVPNRYFVRPVLGGVERATSESFMLPAGAPTRQYLNVPLQRPPGGTVSLPPGTQTPPSGTLSYTYNANDASVSDLDGDGQYEIVLKWDPSNSQDNANEGLTGNVLVDAYRLDGTLLWRIDLGRNIRAGAHYTQFLVYDFDGDGRAEVVMKTADGTVDGAGQMIGDPQADYRDGYTGGGDGRWGRVLAGPEYLTVFDGLTGVALSTIDFSPPRGSVSSWGDSYGNRVDRFLAAVAYLDGERPSIVMARGYYAKTRLTAYDWRDGQLRQRWVFDSTTPGNGSYGGQGNHNLSVADVDSDGRDEIIYGAAVIDHDGTGLYSTGLGHGDALHVTDMLPSRAGLEVFQTHESPSSYGNAGASLTDAATGELIFGIPANNDVGRGVAFDIDPNYPGYEMWATANDPQGNPRMIYSATSQAIYPTPGNMFYNFGVWWDADPLRELLDGTTISDWNYVTHGRQNLVSSSTGPPGSLNNTAGLSSNNGTKSTPVFSADILGDWREEVIWRRSDNTALQIWSTTIPAANRMFTLMHDTKYRLDVAWQNVAYNQPPHPSFFLGAGMEDPPLPQIYTVQSAAALVGDYNANGEVDAADYVLWRTTRDSTTDLRADGDSNGVVDDADYNLWRANIGNMSSEVRVARSETLPIESRQTSLPADYSVYSAFGASDDGRSARFEGERTSTRAPRSLLLAPHLAMLTNSARRDEQLSIVATLLHRQMRPRNDMVDGSMTSKLNVANRNLPPAVVDVALELSVW